jgi:hypothetical protein
MLKEIITDEWLKEILGRKFIICDDAEYKKDLIIAYNGLHIDGTHHWYAFLYEKSYVTKNESGAKGWDRDDTTISNSLKYKHEVLFLLKIVGLPKFK